MKLSLGTGSLVVSSLAFAVAVATSTGCGTSAGANSSDAREQKSPELGTHADAIQGGQVDTANKYRFAVGIYDTSVGGICSGALIAPNLVLTARHCVAEVPEESVDCARDNFGAVTAASNLVVTTDNSIGQGSKNYRARKVFVPTATSFCGNDIALIMLSTSVPAAEATLVVPAVYAPITDHSKFDMKYTAIGYGITSPGSSNSAGTRRYRENISIQCIPGDSLWDCGDLTDAPITEKEFVTAGGTCQGDSGSSAFEQKNFVAGTPVSLGVLSRGGSTQTTCMDAIYTRVDSWRDLVISAAVEAAQTGNYTPPSWTNSTWTPPVTPDAGTPVKPDAGPQKPSPKDNGAACVSNAECASGYCLTDSEGKRTCDEGCTVDADCGTTNECVDQRCTPKAATQPATTPANNGDEVVTTTTTTTTTGCSMHGVAGRSESPLTWMVSGIALAAIAARRKRNRLS